MAASPAPRLSPEVILAPLPGPVLASLGMYVLALILAGIAAIVALFQGLGWPRWLIPVGLGALAAMLIVLRRRSAEAARRERQRFYDEHPAALADPRVQALVQASQHERLPKPVDVRRILEPFPCADRARIVCFGVDQAPEVGELFFEPEIITATELLWRRLIWLWLALGFGALWLLEYVGLWPSWLPPIGRMMRSCNYVYVMGAVALLVWIWRSAIFPTYFRLAPGIIQVLVYRYGRGKPTIRSYPIAAGTLAVLTRHGRPKKGRGKGKGQRWLLTLTRDRQQDRLELWQLRRPNERLERVWQALLSTAPAPPLSDEELID